MIRWVSWKSQSSVSRTYCVLQDERGRAYLVGENVDIWHTLLAQKQKTMAPTCRAIGRKVRWSHNIVLSETRGASVAT